MVMNYDIITRDIHLLLTCDGNGMFFFFSILKIAFHAISTYRLCLSVSDLVSFYLTKNKVVPQVNLQNINAKGV